MHGEVNGEQSIDIEDYDTKGGMLVGFLEKLKDTLKTGNQDLGIPVLDPLQKEHVNVDLNAKGVIELKGALDNFRVHGLSSYTVNQGDFKLAGFLANISLTWNEIDLMTKYNVNGKLADLISIYGDGIIMVQGKDLTVKVDVKLSINDERKLYVKNLSLHVHLKQLQFQITGLNNDAELSKLVSSIVSDITPQLIEDYQEQLSQTVSPLVINELNQLLKDMTLDKLIDIITGKSSPALS
ncbi:uncharacterized protein LOC122404732 [Colletes gigas]|uniref:uncharacterized protein LOC122404732 n=1 Tax=Colletes gigas TaxID=935657 RepID=UPI001C9A54C2|nr:uncharacterized protein LOC122404732 [Colletes gigas]